MLACLSYANLVLAVEVSSTNDFFFFFFQLDLYTGTHLLEIVDPND
jgi:hypothetical protein